MRKVSVPERRRTLVHRHRLDGGATSPEEVTQALVALHATDPASVYLSVLARSHGSTRADVAAAMYERRSLVRWMAMRRTLFVFARDEVPVIQAAVSTPLAATLRRRLISRLDRNGGDPPIDGDVGTWLAGVEDRTEQALQQRGSATGAQLSTDVPGLRTVIAPGSPSEVPQNMTSSLLTVMSAQGRIVRSTPTGAWTSRHHRWEPVDAWWPNGLPQLSQHEAERVLARRWLESFGPATADDLQWWTGWTKTTTARALAGLPIEEVDLHGEPGIALADQIPLAELEDAGAAEPVVALLPSLDPTPMGWKRRDWFLSIDPALIFDRNGNIGPTLWWDGELIGLWTIAPGGEVRVKVVADRGAAAVTAAEQAAADLHAKLDGAVVTPAFKVPVS